MIKTLVDFQIIRQEYWQRDRSKRVENEINSSNGHERRAGNHIHIANIANPAQDLTFHMTFDDDGASITQNQ